MIKEVCPFWVTVFSILPNNQKKSKKDINSKPTKQNKSNPKNKTKNSILSNRCTIKIKDIAKVVEKTKTSSKRKKHNKLSCKKARKTKKSERKHKRMLKEININIRKTKSKWNTPPQDPHVPTYN
jgi:hypothetical protein